MPREGANCGVPAICPRSPLAIGAILLAVAVTTACSHAATLSQERFQIWSVEVTFDVRSQTLRVTDTFTLDAVSLDGERHELSAAWRVCEETPEIAESCERADAACEFEADLRDGLWNYELSCNAIASALGDDGRTLTTADGVCDGNEDLRPPVPVLVCARPIDPAASNHNGGNERTHIDGTTSGANWSFDRQG
jgi:hypothetical protein